MANILNYTCLLVLLVSITSAAHQVTLCHELGLNHGGCSFDMWCSNIPGTTILAWHLCECNINAKCGLAESGTLECTCHRNYEGERCDKCKEDKECMPGITCFNGHCQQIYF